MTDEVKTPPAAPVADPVAAALAAKVDEMSATLAKVVDPDVKALLAKFADAGEKTLAEVRALGVKLTAAETAAGEAAAKLVDASKKSALAEAAKAAGAVDHDAILALTKLDDVKLGEDGKPVNAADVVAALKAAKPALFTATPAAPAGTSAAAAPPAKTEPKTKTARDMEVGSAEYNAALRAAGVDPTRLRRG